MRSKQGHWGFAALATLVFLVCSGYPQRFHDLAGTLFTANGVNDYWKGARHTTGDWMLAEQMAVADYLRQNTAPSDRVFVWGVDPLIYFLAGRQNVSRFVFNHPLMARWTWPALWTDFMGSLRADLPVFFVTEHDDAEPWVTGLDDDSYEALLNRADLREYVLANYELERRIGRFDILRRTPADAPLPLSAGNPARIRADLGDCLNRIADRELDSFRYVFWPTAAPENAARGKLRELSSKLLDYRELDRTLWRDQKELSDFLPAISVWIRGDDRPFARLSPFNFQNDAEHFVVDDYRFTLLDSTSDRRVLTYYISIRTGRESLKRRR